MCPILFEIPIPTFLQGFLPSSVPIYSYGFLIACGAVAAFLYASHQAKVRLGVPKHKTLEMINVIIIASIVGGKLFYYLEKPSYYLADSARLLENFGSGFVFYGSLLFAVPSLWYFFKKNGYPAIKFFDIIAIMLCILHAFGRLGCFMAGCCHGKPWDGPFAISYSDPKCLAPLDTLMHPTQLYSITLILSILSILLYVRTKRQKFDGQIGLLYLMLYAAGRSVIEIFRGDEARGFIIDGLLSYAQFISIILILIAAFFYRKQLKSTK